MLDTSKISIAEVLHLIACGDTFSLQYVRSTGADQGSIKLVEKACRGYNYKKFKVRTEEKENRTHYQNDTIPLIDIGADQQLTLKKSHIIYYNNKKVIH